MSHQLAAEFSEAEFVDPPGACNEHEENEHYDPQIVPPDEANSAMVYSEEESSGSPSDGSVMVCSEGNQSESDDSLMVYSEGKPSGSQCASDDSEMVYSEGECAANQSKEESPRDPYADPEMWLINTMKNDDAEALEQAINDSLLKHEGNGTFAALSCCHYEAKACLDVLLKFDIPLDRPGKSDRTPLRLAAEKASPDFLEYLLKSTKALYSEGRWDMFLNQLSEAFFPHLMDPRFHEEPMYSALHHAVFHNNLDNVRVLLKAGAKPNILDEQYFHTPLGTAAELSYTEVAKELLLYGADPNAAGELLTSPLMSAVLSNEIEVVELMIKAGAVVDQTSDMHTETPLMAAVEMGYIDMAKLLLDHGANIKECNMNYSLMHFAVLSNRMEMVELVIAHMPSGFVPYDDALHLACEVGQLDIAKRLVKFGYHFLMKDEEGYTALARSVKSAQTLRDQAYKLKQKGMFKMLQFAVQEARKYSPPEVLEQQLSMALAQACFGASYKTIEWLLSVGADPVLPVPIRIPNFSRIALNKDQSRSLVLAWLMIAPSHELDFPEIPRRKLLRNFALILQTGCPVDISFHPLKKKDMHLCLMHHAVGIRDLTVIKMLWVSGGNYAEPDFDQEQIISTYSENVEGKIRILADQKDVDEYINHVMRQPRSLASQCCILIRKLLRKNCRAIKAECLDVPKDLQEQIMLTELFGIVDADDEIMGAIVHENDTLHRTNAAFSFCFYFPSEESDSESWSSGSTTTCSMMSDMSSEWEYDD